MSTYQKIVVIGHAGDDPQVKRFDNGGMIANLPVATTETWKDKNTGEKKSLTEWHRVVINGKLAELAEKYVKKGDKVLIEGIMRTRKYTVTDGSERYTTELICKELRFMGSASGNNTAASTEANTAHTNGEEHDDLPF